MEKHLVIFGTSQYKNSINSLVRSSSNFFDKIHIFNEENIDFLKNKTIDNLKLIYSYLSF